MTARRSAGLGMRGRWRSSIQSLVPRGRRRRTAGGRQQVATLVAVPEAKGKVGGVRALPRQEAVAELRFGTPRGAEAAQRPAAQVAPMSHTDRVVPDWISAWRE